MRTCVLAIVIASCQAFTPVSNRWACQSNVVLNAEASSRREMLSGVGFVGIAASVLANPSTAVAGYLNKDSLPEVLAPNAAAVDREVLKSAKVQDALKDVSFFVSVSKEMAKQLEGNNQIDLGPGIRKYFPFDKIRESLNVINEALDEDTQRGTDRLIRNAIQDITELEVANKLKPGIARSDRKVVIMYGKLQKLDTAFSDFLSFFI
mmetsp:Transcript_87549/g.175149  ORF Transcript_87549/g.175149 Transcript_87549/m.175149 type:complete len:207 (-) Transcript_87549:113-733(-)